MTWAAPCLLGYSAVILLGPVQPAVIQLVGWAPRLVQGWVVLVLIVQGVFVLGFVGGCLFLIRKAPSRPLRTALLGLAIGQSALGLNGLLLATGRWAFSPFLSSELLMLLTLWYAYETSSNLQQTG